MVANRGCGSLTEFVIDLGEHPLVDSKISCKYFVHLNPSVLT
jgi:hypothetical protein